MVTDMRPLRVESADMRELMYGFAERFRSEYGLAVDLFIEDRDLRLPDRICRELIPDLPRITTQRKKACEGQPRRGKTRARRGESFSLSSMTTAEGFSFSGRYRKRRTGPAASRANFD